MDDFGILPITLCDLDDLVLLHAQYLNYGSGIYTHFKQVLSNEDAIAVKCVHGSEMVGVDIYTRGIFLSGGHPELCEQIRALTGDALTYTGDALLVKPHYRKRGLDALMLSKSKELMQARGVVYVLYELWVHPDGHMPARHTVERYDHVIDLGIHSDFYVDFDHYGYYCPICGEKCQCSAHLYLCRLG